jgi:hypothetical protein
MLVLFETPAGYSLFKVNIQYERLMWTQQNTIQYENLSVVSINIIHANMLYCQRKLTQCYLIDLFSFFFFF